MERFIEFLQTLCYLTVELSIGDALEISKLLDPTFSVDLRGDETHASQNDVLSKARNQEVDMTHAVQHWKNHRSGSHSSSEVIHSAWKRVALYGEEDQVIRFV